MKNLFVIYFFFFAQGLFSQTLIPNGDFETYGPLCPGGFGQIAYANGWSTTSDPVASGSTPDFFNACANSNLLGVGVPLNEFGWQQAHSGVGYSGIILYHEDIQQSREYLQVKLDPGIVAGTCYRFEMYVSISNGYSMYTTDAIGVYFSEDSIYGYNNYLPLPFITQLNNTVGNYPDTSGWTLVSIDFTATGNEKYAIIGNFNDNIQTNIMTINPTSLFPTVYSYVDDVSLSECGITGSKNILEKSIHLFPNPFNCALTITSLSLEEMEIFFYDPASRLVKQLTFSNTVTFSMEELAAGSYFYTIRNKYGEIEHGRIMKN